MKEIRRKEANYINMNQEKKLWQPARRKGTELGRKGVTVPGSTSWLPLEKRHLKNQCMEVVRKRRDECVGNGRNPSGVQNREDSGAGLKTATYGRHCVPLGKSGNLQRILLHRPPPKKKNLVFLPLEKICREKQRLTNTDLQWAMTTLMRLLC